MRKSSAIILAIVVGIVCAAITYSVMIWDFNARMEGSGDSLSLKEFRIVEEVIKKYYLRDYDIKEVEYAGLKAMIASLGDPYSVYYTPEEFAAFNRNSTGEYNGVGMGITKDEVTGLTVVSYFMEGSAAEAAGIKVGDYIISLRQTDDKSWRDQRVCIGRKHAITSRQAGDEFGFTSCAAIHWMGTRRETYRYMRSTVSHASAVNKHRRVEESSQRVL